MHYYSKSPISSYYQIDPWIPESKLDFDLLLDNPNPLIMNVILKNLNKINWQILSEKNYAMDILLEHPDKIKCDRLAQNTDNRAIEYLKKNCNNIHWYFLSNNPNSRAIALLEQNQNRINWHGLSSNTNNRAVRLLRDNFNQINWESLSSNTSDAAVKLLLENPRFIDWMEFSKNTNPNAIKYMSNHLEDIDWRWLSENEAAIHILLSNPHRIRYPDFYRNPHPKAIELIKQKIANNELRAQDFNYLERNLNPDVVELIKRFQPNRQSWGNLSRNPGIFMDINKPAKVIQGRYKNMINNRKTKLKQLGYEMSYMPPGAIHPNFPGGKGYHETHSHYNQLRNSFGKKRTSLSVLRSDLKKVLKG